MNFCIWCMGTKIKVHRDSQVIVVSNFESSSIITLIPILVPRLTVEVWFSANLSLAIPSIIMNTPCAISPLANNVVCLGFSINLRVSVISARSSSSSCENK